MQLTCDLKSIRDAVNAVKAAVLSRGGALPILGGIRIDAAEDGTVTLHATNLDLTLTATFQADVGAPGAVIVHKKLLESVVKGKGTVAFTADEEAVTVVNGSTTVMRAMPLEEWPKLKGAPNAEDAGTVIPADAIWPTIVAAGTENSRPILTGVLFTGDRLVCTDSYRLHETLIDQAPIDKVLIPAGLLAAVAKAAGGTDLTMRVDPIGCDVHLAGGNVTAVVRLIEGEFPNYKTLIPASHPWAMSVDQAQFLDALAQVVIMVRDTATPVRISFPDLNVAQLKVISQEMGEAVATVPCSWPTWQRPDDGFTVAVNPKYLKETVSSLPAGTVSINMLDNLKPIDVTSAARVGDHRLLMPVRVP